MSSIIITIVVTVVLFGLLIFIHELGHFLVAKASKIQVNEFAIGMGPCLFSRQKGETQYSVRAFPIGGYVQMEGEDEDSDNVRSFNNAHILKRIAVLIAGPLMNFVLGIVLMGIITATQSQVVVPVVGSITEGYESQSAFEAGDELVKVNGSRIVSASDFTFQLSRVDTNEPINVTVKRDGQTIILEDVAFEVENEDGTTSKMLGVTLEVQDLNIKNFFSTTFGNTLYYSKAVWSSLTDLVTGKVSISEVSGPIGVGQAVNQVVSDSQVSIMSKVISLLSFGSLISINLGIFNLLPFPALDGGRLVFLLIEAITRRKVNKKVEQYVNATGLTLLMLLMVVVAVKDVFQLF